MLFIICYNISEFPEQNIDLKSKKKKRHRKVSIFKLLKQAKLNGDKCQNSGLGEDLVTGGGK